MARQGLETVDLRIGGTIRERGVEVALHIPGEHDPYPALVGIVVHAGRKTDPGMGTHRSGLTALVDAAILGDHEVVGHVRIAGVPFLLLEFLDGLVLRVRRMVYNDAVELVLKRSGGRVVIPVVVVRRLLSAPGGAVDNVDAVAALQLVQVRLGCDVF